MSFLKSMLKSLFGTSTATRSVPIQTQSKPSEMSKPTKPDVKPVLPWMVEAEKILDLHERRNGKELKAWLKSDGATLGDPSELPWCGDYVETAICLGNKKEVPPKNPYLAMNWLKYGKSVVPQYGAILVFHRGDPNSHLGHVAFCLGEEGPNFIILGGNQSDKVSIMKMSKSKLRTNGSRWPTLGPTPGNYQMKSVAEVEGSVT